MQSFKEELTARFLVERYNKDNEHWLLVAIDNRKAS